MGIFSWQKNRSTDHDSCLQIFEVVLWEGAQVSDRTSEKKPMNDSVFLEMEQSISDALLPPSKNVTQCGTHHATVCHVEVT